MRHMTIAALAAVGFALAACDHQLPKISYHKPAEVTSDRTAVVGLETGLTEGTSMTTMAPVGGVFIPITSGPNPNLHFNRRDQNIFAASLYDELQRLNIVKVIPAKSPEAKQAELGILLYFVQTAHDAANNDYTLDVVLQLQTPQERFVKRYRVRGQEDKTFWEKFNMTPQRGKEFAAQKLMDVIVPDIESVVKSLGPRDAPPSVAAPQV